MFKLHFLKILLLGHTGNAHRIYQLFFCLVTRQILPFSGLMVPVGLGVAFRWGMDKTKWVVLIG